MLLALGRNGRLSELITLLQQERPNVVWPPVPDNFKMPESVDFGNIFASPHRKEQTITHQINTGGGAYIGGVVNTGGGEFTGRDKIIYGDTMASNEIAAAFVSIQTAVDQAKINDAQKIIVQTAVDTLRMEANKGAAANANVVEQWLGILVQMAPDIAKVTIDIFTPPVTGLSIVFQKVSQKTRAQQKD